MDMKSVRVFFCPKKCVCKQFRDRHENPKGEGAGSRDITVSYDRYEK